MGGGERGLWFIVVVCGCGLGGYGVRGVGGGGRDVRERREGGFMALCWGLDWDWD